ncbi:DNA polymerase III subunit beta [Limisphaera sp. VF-2]|jgi:DNA polymerase-3 subunit beta|uniref:DNA polymerase III subunit beta n=1 Tax=Limisphaera sp. VF-2 TaxID=3400418 RepID=UPI0017732518|nr:DNA polymerase III subunit beta [Limisphaera sp.]
MNLTIAKEHLLSGLQAVQNVAGGRTTLPILHNVLLRAQPGQLELTATDLDMTVSCSVPATVGSPGATTVPAKTLFGIVRELNGLEIEMEVDEKNTCSLRAASSYYRLRGISADEFPPLPVFPKAQQVELPRERLAGMLRKTSFAMSTDESRYVLNGVFFSLKEHKLTLVATDGRRLALVEEEVDLPEQGQGEFILPAKAVGEMARLLPGPGNVLVRFAENQAAFEFKDEKGAPVLLITKLVEGHYPNYRQVIPTEARERVTLPREEFLHALRRAEFMTSDKANSVKLTFTRNNLAITANSPDVGEARESLAINYAGNELAIAFNPRYLIEPLTALTEYDEVFLELTDELSPGVLKVNGPFLYVVMPMRLT